MWAGKNPGIFFANLYLNGAILVVFILGVLSTFGQVWQLIKSVQWIEGFASDRIGADLIVAPSLLAPLATLLKSRGARTAISAGSSRSILETVGQRIDEDREITRYIGNTLIFLGLLGTFYGLATTVPALVETIRSLAPSEGESGAAVFSRLQQGLEARNWAEWERRFHLPCLGLPDHWLSDYWSFSPVTGKTASIVSLKNGCRPSRVLALHRRRRIRRRKHRMASFVDHLAEQIEAMQQSIADSEAKRAEMNVELTNAVKALGQNGSSDATNEQLEQVIAGQKELLEQLAKTGGDGMDAESRMRLRSIDVQLLRLLEEMSAGRQESTASIRNDLAALTPSTARRKKTVKPWR